MTAIPAVYEDGVFRPTGPVDLPEGAVVDVRPAEVDDQLGQLGPMNGIYAVLSERYDSGHHDTAERHNEHQP